MADVPSYSEDLFTDDAIMRPYGRYRELRELGPVVWLEAHRMYVLPRYAEARAVLADPDVFCSGRGVGLNDVVNTVGLGTTLMSDGATVYQCTSPHQVVELLEGGRGVFGIALGAACRELETALGALHAERTDTGETLAGYDPGDELARRRNRAG